MGFIKVVKLTIILSILLYSNLNAGEKIIVGAERTDKYIHLLKGKKVALVANQTSRVGNKHLLDTLMSLGINVVRVFAPEHGFRGDVSAGIYVKDNIDTESGVKVVSIYGRNKKPSANDIKDLDWVIFDIQDVGARFYTYISTLHYVMEACAENNVPLMVLDRPNPNGHYIDGPVLKAEFKSFVGMHPVPVVHGMTIGEYAQMINGEGWLENGIQTELIVIEVENYNHSKPYHLPIPPSPNLQSQEAIYLYPSLCFFEGTNVSVGRGTDSPFELIGKPGFEIGNYKFTPKKIPGIADNPPHEGNLCNGFKLTEFANDFIYPSAQIYLLWLTGFYEASENKSNFFNNFFDRLAGTDQLRKQIIEGLSVDEIRVSWQEELYEFRKTRSKYLIYR